MDDKQGDVCSGFKAKYAIYIIFAVLVFMGIFLLLDSATTTYAVYNPEKTGYYLDNLDELKSAFNSKSENIPFVLKWMFGDERINLTFIRISGEKVILAVETDNGLMDRVRKGEMQNPSMQMEVQESAMKRISESEHPVDELEEALDNGEIKYSSRGLTSWMKSLLVSAAINTMSVFL